MGKIEESITENYKKALSLGDINQAKRSVELARILKDKIENELFDDYDLPNTSGTYVIGNFFEPYMYRYIEVSGTVEISSTLISLTESENRLFSLLSQNETFGDNISVIKQSQIKQYLWPDKSVTNNAVRVLIKRLRKKIEPDPVHPQILLNYNKKGYIFVARKTA